MIAPLALLLFAAAGSTLGPWVLRRQGLADRSPALGIVLWQALSASVIAATVLAGLALALPELPATTSLATLLSACTAALREQYATPAGAAASATGAVLAIGVTARIGYCLAAGLLQARAERAHQLQALRLIATRDGSSGALVVDHEGVAAYCLPGQGGQVVLTTGALAQLDDHELQAVLAHERAHLSHRHHLVAALSAALYRAFPRVPVFAHAHHELATLVEMHADDVAARGNDRVRIATALVRLAEATTPAAALGIGGETAVARVRRLVRPENPLGRARSAATILTAVAITLAPGLIATAPALAVATAELCPITF